MSDIGRTSIFQPSRKTLRDLNVILELTRKMLTLILSKPPKKRFPSEIENLIELVKEINFFKYQNDP